MGVMYCADQILGIEDPVSIIEDVVHSYGVHVMDDDFTVDFSTFDT
jgi:hypothetical protein